MKTSPMVHPIPESPIMTDHAKAMFPVTRSNGRQMQIPMLPISPSRTENRSSENVPLQRVEEQEHPSQAGLILAQTKRPRLLKPSSNDVKTSLNSLVRRKVSGTKEMESLMAWTTISWKRSCLITFKVERQNLRRSERNSETLVSNCHHLTRTFIFQTMK